MSFGLITDHVEKSKIGISIPSEERSMFQKVKWPGRQICCCMFIYKDSAPNGAIKYGSNHASNFQVQSTGIFVEKNMQVQPSAKSHQKKKFFSQTEWEHPAVM